MCLILFAYHIHPEYQLIVAANRDEFYQRPTAPAHYWEDHPEILAGRDLEKMGTWMGVNLTGHFSALTNYRNPKETQVGKHSRGELVHHALTFKGDLKDYMESLKINKDLYPGFNLLAGSIEQLYYYSNVSNEVQRINKGVHGVSNHLLNSEWPKVKKGKDGLLKIINEEEENQMVEKLFQLLENTDRSPDEELPNTGVSLEMERMLSPLFIKSEDYGTRSSTVLFISEKKIKFIEKVFTKGEVSSQKFSIRL